MHFVRAGVRVRVIGSLSPNRPSGPSRDSKPGPLQWQASVFFSRKISTLFTKSNAHKHARTGLHSEKLIGENITSTHHNSIHLAARPDKPGRCRNWLITVLAPLRAGGCLHGRGELSGTSPALRTGPRPIPPRVFGPHTHTHFGASPGRPGERPVKHSWRAARPAGRPALHTVQGPVSG